MGNAVLHQCLGIGWSRTSSAAADSLTGAAGLLRASARRIEARWESRVRAAVAARELSSMSERELHDLGISRSDIPRLAREANAASAT